LGIRTGKQYYISKEATEAEPLHFEAVIGKPIKVVDFLETFIYWHEQVRTWAIVEVRTGIQISTSSTTQKGAVAEAKRRIEYNGKEKILAQIEQLVTEYGEVPRTKVVH